jgi:pimeloyl-ACP methyl ester carboxylesterase
MGQTANREKRMPMSGGIYYSGTPEQTPGLPVLVLLHGAGGVGEQWPYQLRRLPGWRVLAPDLPGHGSSQGVAERNIMAYANRIWDWLAALHVERAVLGGHSMGAAVAMEMAMAEPAKVPQLILLGAAARFPVNPELTEKLSVPIRLQAGVNLIVKWSFAKGADERLRRTYFKQLIANSPGVLYNDFVACANFDLGRRATELSRPTLILAGQQDLMVPLRLSEALATSLPRAQLRTVPGGHMLMQETTEEVVQIIETALQERKAD